MAAPLLKKTTAATSSVRLKTSGAAHSSAPRLKNAGGHAITPKKPTALAPSKKHGAEPKQTPAPAEESTPTPDPVTVAVPMPSPDPESVPVPESAPVPEAEAAPASVPVPEAEATPETAPEPVPPTEQQAVAEAEEAVDAATAEAQADAQAKYEREMEEYQRQVEEYNKKMEEYNRQMAAMQQQQQSAAPAGKASAHHAKPKAGGLKPVKAKGAAKTSAKVGKPGSAAKHSPVAAEPTAGVAADAEGTEDAAEGMSAVEAAYIEQLRARAEKPSIWRRKGFWIAAIVFVAFAGVCGVKVMQEKAVQDRAKARNARIKALLKRAQEINMNGVESLADAKAKNVDVKCSLQDAKFLMDVVVNPNMKDEKEKPMLGGDPEGVAKLACLLLGITAEESDEAAKMIFTRLEKEVKQIKPSLYRWLIQRLAVADIKDINGKLRHLTEVISKMPAKGFSRRDEVLSYIWETMGLRITEKDVPMITELLKDPEMNTTLAATLARCLSNVLDLMDDPAKKKELGDKIFDLIPESRRSAMAAALGRACSPKALAYYQQLAQDPAKWRNVFEFFANYEDDSVVTFLTTQLRPKAEGDAKKEKLVESMLEAVLGQNRDRKPEDADKLIHMVYDKIDTNINEWAEVNAKTDPDSSEFVGKDSPKYAQLMKKREDIEKARKQKLAFVHVMKNLFDWPWVVQSLKKLEESEEDGELRSEIRRALTQVVTNREEDKSIRDKYKKRTTGQ